MKNLTFLAVVLLCILGCKKEDNQPAEPDQATIEQNLIGRWVGTLELEIPMPLGIQRKYVDYDVSVSELTLGAKAGEGISTFYGNACQMEWKYTAFSGTRATFEETSPCYDNYTPSVWFTNDDFNTLSVIIPDVDYPELSWLGFFERQ